MAVLSFFHEPCTLQAGACVGDQRFEEPEVVVIEIEETVSPAVALCLVKGIGSTVAALEDTLACWNFSVVGCECGEDGGSHGQDSL